jgi:broad specificity phosphatase PhoE
LITRILLIRHGNNDFVGQTLVGRMPGIHLNQEGQDQVARLAKRLSNVKLSVVYCSPMERARETAAAFEGIPFHISEELNEINFGDWTGLTFEDLQRRPEWDYFNRNRASATIPGGESLIQVQQRMLRKAEEVRQHHKGETIAFISHGDPIKALIAHYIGMDLGHLLHLEVGVASVSVIHFYDDWPVVILVNDTDGIP